MLPWLWRHRRVVLRALLVTVALAAYVVLAAPALLWRWVGPLRRRIGRRWWGDEPADAIMVCDSCGRAVYHGARMDLWWTVWTPRPHEACFDGIDNDAETAL
jgi:hypothetical protein